jgi:ribose 5-phosphate isomerase B
MGEFIKKHLSFLGYEVKDLGCFIPDRCDYPNIAAEVCQDIKNKDIKGRTKMGILFCGTGIGISIAANKIRGIRCALCHDHYTAVMSRKHNNANVLSLGGRTTGKEIAKEIVETFLTTEFEGGRHETRVQKIMALE